jgi:hypothetical protein
MTKLIQNFLDIIMLRKGPDIIPSSWLVFLASIILLAISSSSVLILIKGDSNQEPLINLTAYVSGILFYCFIIIFYGYGNRALQSISAIIACGSLITITFVIVFIFFTPFLGVNFASVIAGLIMLWSIPVEGHIIAITINKNRFFGILIALSALCFQFLIQSQILNQS